MGDCNCASDIAVGRIKAPDGWYILNVYSGCDECEQVCGVDISFCGDAKDYEDMHYDELPDLTEKMKAQGEVFLRVLDWSKLEQAFNEEWDGEPMSEYDHPADFIHDNAYLIGIASRITEALR